MKRPACTLALIGLAALTAGLAPATPAPQDARQDSSQIIRDTVANRTINIYKLKHSSASELADVVTRVIRLSPGEITAVDERTNALIVAALEPTHEEVADLLERLDQPVESTTPNLPVGIFPIKHVQGGALVATIEHLMRSSTWLTIGYDSGSSSIVVRGEEEDLQMAEQLIESLDVPTARRMETGKQVTLRICWLANGVDGLRHVPADLGDVEAELGRLGVEGLGLVAQTTTTITAGKDFQSNFTALLDGSWDVNMDGATRIVDSQYVIDIGINGKAREAEQAVAAAADGRAAATRVHHDSVLIETTITTPGNHYVVLGMTPILNTDSVFVVQVIP